MKIKLENDYRVVLFKSLKEHGYNTKKISETLRLHRRTVSDWKRGKFNIEQVSFNTLVKLSRINPRSLKYEIIDTQKQKIIISSLGGRARWEKHGFIGTKEDQIKGGFSSYKIRKNNKDDIFTKKKILKPGHTTEFAEFIGICMGDGGISNYQVSISLSNEDDLEYMDYVSDKATQLFGLRVKMQKRTKSKCTNLVLSSIDLVDFLILNGLPKGDKIRAKLDFPEWVRCDTGFTKACIRGLFDTDGSIYLETHHIKGKSYSYPRLSFVSASEPLRESFCDSLVELGLNARIRMNRCVTIERFTDIEKYFRIIGSSNQKHLSRYAQFGGVG